MRDILFRGKAIGGLNAGRWIYGYYVKDFWTPSSVGHGIIPADRDIGGYCEVYPDTVGQYTGLTDKNGERIFEGDIVTAYNAMGECTHTATAVKWNDFFAEWSIGKCNSMYSDGSICSYEVIGNIHDNKLEDFENEC